MQEMIAAEKAAKRAAELFGNGYHCAEAVTVGVLETMGEDSSLAVRYATGFGGGYGTSFCEVCGVVSGALVVIGHLFGRQQQGESWQEAATLSAMVLERFAEQHMTTNCGTLRKRFGTEKQMEQCRELVRLGTVDLVNILNDYNNCEYPESVENGQEKKE